MAKYAKRYQADSGDTPPPVIRNHHCHAYGCPMPGSMTDTPKSGPDTPWYCRFHHGVTDIRDRDAITLRIKQYQDELVPLLGKRGVSTRAPIDEEERLKIEKYTRGLEQRPTYQGVKAQEYQQQTGFKPISNYTPEVEV